ncbi:hypothetical protein [Streptomyces sp. NPDC096311]
MSPAAAFLDAVRRTLMARSNGWPDIASRGRVPAEVREAFDKTNKDM